MTVQYQDKFDETLTANKAMFLSWLSIKTPVMIWLWYLNALYIGGLAVFEQAETFWILLSYIAIVPIASYLLNKQRGLTRLTGLIHLPWFFLVIYLALRLFSDVLGPMLSAEGDVIYYVWLHFVFWSTLVCVIFDVFDILRWFKGEKYVLGTPLAHQLGASKLAKL